MKLTALATLAIAASTSAMKIEQHTPVTDDLVQLQADAELEWCLTCAVR